MVRPALRKKRWYRSPKALRHATMLFFFVFMAHIAIGHQLQGGGPRGTPSVEAYCPFGGLETLYQFLTTGGFVHRIEPSALILFAALLLLTLVASRGFCGWMCPFGSVQEWLGILGRRLFRKRFNPGGRLDAALRYAKYFVLALIISLTWHTGSLIFRDYDPFLAFFHFGRGIDELPWAYAILLAVLLGSLWIERFFCKYACPLGAVLGIVGRFGLTKIRRDAAACKECNLCRRKCHAHVDFLSGATIRSAECNQCMDCVADCPRPAVLAMRGLRLRFSHPVFAATLVMGLLGLVYTSKAAGKWQTRPAQASFTGVGGALHAGQIRGWMTLNDISAGYGIPLPELFAAGRLPARVSASTRLNRIRAEHKVEFEPEVIRDFVAAKVARPMAAAPAETPPRAGAGSGPSTSQNADRPHGSSDEPEIKGFMTLNEIVLKTGVPRSYILSQLGLKEAEVDGRLPLRDWIHAKGKSVPELRSIVQEYKGAKNR